MEAAVDVARIPVPVLGNGALQAGSDSPRIPAVVVRPVEHLVLAAPEGDRGDIVGRIGVRVAKRDRVAHRHRNEGVGDRDADALQCRAVVEIGVGERERLDLGARLHLRIGDLGIGLYRVAQLVIEQTGGEVALERRCNPADGVAVEPRARARDQGVRRIKREKAATLKGVLADAVDVDELEAALRGEARIGARTADVVETVLRRDRALARQQAAILIVCEVADERPAVVGAEAGAGGDGAQISRVVALLGDPVLAPELDAVEAVLEDEVDDAGDGLRAVDGRCAAGHDLDAVDEVGRDVVEVDRRRTGQTRDEAAAVNEHERAVRAEVAQVDRRDTVP